MFSIKRHQLCHCYCSDIINIKDGQPGWNSIIEPIPEPEDSAATSKQRHYPALRFQDEGQYFRPGHLPALTVGTAAVGYRYHCCPIRNPIELKV
jgi:hypothetical protein